MGTKVLGKGVALFSWIDRFPHLAGVPLYPFFNFSMHTTYINFTRNCTGGVIKYYGLSVFRIVDTRPPPVTPLPQLQRLHANSLLP